MINLFAVATSMICCTSLSRMEVAANSANYIWHLINKSSNANNISEKTTQYVLSFTEITFTELTKII